MAAPNLPVISYLGTLQVDTTGSGAWADIGQVQKFKPPQMKVGDSQNTYLQQSAPWRTYQPGWGEPGEATFTIMMRQSDYNTLFGYFTNRTSKNFRIRYNDGSTPSSGSVLTFGSAAYINELGDDEVSRDSELPIMTSGKIKVSGLPTYAPAT